MLLGVNKIILFYCINLFIGPPCKRIKPYFHKLAEQFKDVKFISIDVDQAESICQEVGITCMPTFVFYKDGKVVSDKRLEGANENELKSRIESL
ncbi:MAG: thioredoxin family protein [archaeon]|nr:thioredoxin family protein [archaeon]